MSKKNSASENSVTLRKPKLTMGERFKDARIVHNRNGKQSTDAVMKAVGISKSTLSDIENDKRDPGAETICTLARHYGVSTDFLLGLSDIKTPETTAQAVISYIGLSEENVKTLHEMSKNIYDKGISKIDGDTVVLDGNKPFIDCLNDLLDAIYNDRETILKHYIRLRRKTQRSDAIDKWYVMGEVRGSIPGFEPSQYSNWASQIPHDNELVEFDCMVIARKVEEILKNKYCASQEEIAQLSREMEEFQSRYTT